MRCPFCEIAPSRAGVGHERLADDVRRVRAVGGWNSCLERRREIFLVSCSLLVASRQTGH